MITYPDPESHRNGIALQDMLCKYADVDQVNAALQQIDALLERFEGSISELQQQISNLSSGVLSGVSTLDGGDF